MVKSNLETDYIDAVNSFEKRSSASNYIKVIERCADLEKRGLMQKPESILLPIEDRYKITFEHCRDNEGL